MKILRVTYTTSRPRWKEKCYHSDRNVKASNLRSPETGPAIGQRENVCTQIHQPLTDGPSPPETEKMVMCKGIND